jgi:hypothetical protein
MANGCIDWYREENRWMAPDIPLNETTPSGIRLPPLHRRGIWRARKKIDGWYLMFS